MSSRQAHKKTATKELADRLHSTAIHLLRRLRRQDQAMGIGSAQASALSVLVFGGPMNLGQLAAAEQVRPPTMSRVIDGLEQAGLVERVRSSTDRRQVQLRATARGTRLMHEGRQRRVDALAAPLRQLPAGDVQRLAEAVAVLEKLLREPG